MNYNNYDHQAYIDSHKPSNFKVGDWVVNGDYDPHDPENDNQFYQWSQGDEHNICFYPTCYSMDTLWQPTEGEWCWFFNAEDTYPKIRRFVGMSLAGRCKYTNNLACDHCEPFIGTLPTWCK